MATRVWQAIRHLRRALGIPSSLLIRVRLKRLLALREKK